MYLMVVFIVFAVLLLFIIQQRENLETFVVLLLQTKRNLENICCFVVESSF